MDKSKKKPWLFKFIKYLVRLFYPKMEVVGLENLPDEPCVIIGNHTQLHGPIAGELFFPDTFYTWCAAPMMKLKEVPPYAYKDFWSQKPKVLKPLFKLISYIIAPLSVLIFNNARTIAVYRDNRILSTFRDSVTKLKNGNSIIIFPEQDKKHNHIVYDFQEGFVDIARLYYKRTGKELYFVPLYIAPKLKSMFLGKPIKFSADTPIAEERRRICDYLMNEITDIAINLPEHTVIPYRNIPKKYYPKNIQKEGQNEKATN
ncbi:MAG: 1-acyl-sn-glycerol-3-phosphate acyltransferase [Clostridia bacterium]|nr:1-acyl-sn-glycerol-3-phosphate acyltransferase [Clostridia bacterium]